MNSPIALFASPNGRIARGRFWLGAIILLVVFAAISFALIGLGLGTTVSGTQTTQISGQATQSFQFFETTLNPLPTLIVAIVWAVPFGMLAVKRRHDRANPGWDAIAILAAGLIAQLLDVLQVTGAVTSLLQLIAFVGGIYLLVVLGFLRGTTGPNAFGVDPLQG